METLTPTQPNESGLLVLDAREVSLRELADKYKGLTIAGVDDRDGYKKVHDARMALKAERVQMKKDGEALRENAVKFQKLVIERVNDLTLIISPIEAQLEAEESRIDQEKEELRKQKEMEEAKVLQDRLTSLSAYNFAHDYLEVKHMSDDQFEDLLATAKNLHEVELTRLAELKAEEDRKRKEEDERLQREREELVKQRAEQEKLATALRLENEKREQKFKEEQDRVRKEHEQREASIRQEREKFEEEKRKHEEKILIAEAEERARIEAENKIKREAQEKEEREQRYKEEAERRESLRPDKDKLFAFGMLVNDAAFNNAPEITDDVAKKCLIRFQVSVHQAVADFSHDLNSI